MISWGGGGSRDVGRTCLGSKTWNRGIPTNIWLKTSKKPFKCFPKKFSLKGWSLRSGIGPTWSKRIRSDEIGAGCDHDFGSSGSREERTHPKGGWSTFDARSRRMKPLLKIKQQLKCSFVCFCLWPVENSSQTSFFLFWWATLEFVQSKRWFSFLGFNRPSGTQRRLELEWRNSQRNSLRGWFRSGPKPRPRRRRTPSSPGPNEHWRRRPTFDTDPRR